MATTDALRKRIDSMIEQVEQQRTYHSMTYGGYKTLLLARLERRLTTDDQDGEPLVNFLARFNAARARVMREAI